MSGTFQSYPTLQSGGSAIHSVLCFHGFNYFQGQVTGLLYEEAIHLHDFNFDISENLFLKIGSSTHARLTSFSEYKNKVADTLKK